MALDFCSLGLLLVQAVARSLQCGCQGQLWRVCAGSRCAARHAPLPFTQLHLLSLHELQSPPPPPPLVQTLCAHALPPLTTHQRFYAAGDAFDQILFDGDPTRQLGRRLLQANAVAHTIAFILMVLLLVARSLLDISLWLLQQLFSVIGMDGSALGPKLYGLPSFAIAVRSRLLIGPTSYAMTANPKYQKAFGLDMDQEDDAAGPPGSAATTTKRRKKKKRRHKVQGLGCWQPGSLVGLGAAWLQRLAPSWVLGLWAAETAAWRLVAGRLLDLGGKL